jgi:integrase
MPRRNTVPSYRLHKQSGQAIVTLTDGLGGRRDVLLGKHGSAESRQEYARVIAEWEAGGRSLLPASAASPGLTVNELILAYWRHAEGYYRKNGEPTAQLHRVRLALRPVRELYGHTAAANFGPKALKAVREQMLQGPCGHCKGAGRLPPPKGKRLNRRSGNAGPVCRRCRGAGKRGWARKHINSCVGCVKRMFKWGVAEELIPPSVYQGLQAVEGLRKGRTAARETAPVRPVEEAHVEAVLPYLTRPVRAMVQLQQLTGMRPGEVVILRPCDVDRSRGAIWVYRPESHKTEHHGIARVIFLGPRAQAVLAPFLLRDPGAYCFSPREAMAEFRERQRQNRKTKVQPSQADRSRPRPRRQPGDRYSVDTYGNAVERACLRADRDARAKAVEAGLPREEAEAKALVPAWHPNQLRHTKATEIRREAGLDAARAVLGHRSPQVTEVYAEVDQDKAAAVMERLG